MAGKDREEMSLAGGGATAFLVFTVKISGIQFLVVCGTSSPVLAMQ